MKLGIFLLFVLSHLHSYTVYGYYNPTCIFTPMQFVPDPTKTGHTLCSNENNQIEVNALTQFFNEMNGEDWDFLGNWLDMSVSICDWGGITCKNCKVTELQIIKNKLIGTIPSEITNLHYLNTVVLSCNSIRGGLEFLSKMSNLILLDLSSNTLAKNLPDLSLLVNLNFINLSYNYITDTLDNVFNNSMIQGIDLSYNKLSGVIPDSINNCKNLTKIFFNNNKLNGNLPILTLPKLLLLDLSHNEFENSIPNTLFDNTHLIHIDLSHNNLSGSLPTNWLNLQYLKKIYLNNNSLNGSLILLEHEDYVFREIVDLSDNQFSDNIHGLSIFSSDFMLLKNNNFSGNIDLLYQYISYIDIRGNNNMISHNTNHYFLEPIDLYVISDNYTCHCVRTNVPLIKKTIIVSDPQYFNYEYCI